MMAALILTPMVLWAALVIFEERAVSSLWGLLFGIPTGVLLFFAGILTLVATRGTGQLKFYLERDL